MDLAQKPKGLSVVLFIFVILFSACSKEESPLIRDAAITAGYPALYDAVLNREAATLLRFTTDSSEAVRRQAWRALAQTPVDSLSSFIEQVKAAERPEAWFALSMHELSPQQLRNLETYWLENKEQRAGISLVMGQQGDRHTLEFMLDQVEQHFGKFYEAEAALAISRLITRAPIEEQQQLVVINAAFSSGEPNLIRRWLYGFYRGDSESLTPAVKDSLLQNWKNFGMGESSEVDQYVAGIIGAPVFRDIVEEYQSSGELENEVQLGIALAQLSDNVELNDENVTSVRALIDHSNPHVVQQALAALSGRLTAGDSLYSFIHSYVLKNEETSSFVWLQGLNTVAEVDEAVVMEHAEQLNEISDANPYLFPQVLQVWMKAEDDKTFVARLGKTVEQGDPLKSMYAINALNSLWAETEQKNALKPQVRTLTFDALALNDRGVTFSTQSLLNDSTLFTTDDFNRINQYLQNFSLPGDIEVYQTFGSLYKQRFKEQAQPVIDSLAALEYVPLNRSLQQAGWEVGVPAEVDQKFRAPNWSRLWELGEHPVWVLETEKGEIKVEMNTLSAPATVSAIDSLTRAGAYDGVPFHRVVPNFVIQGGDIERRDGFGGPDFTIPTEASEQEFVRGAAGIASAGPDTEGSQYFFMHQWKPHLNGGYTLFGHVAEGMDIVDRIIVGDKVTRAYWE